jgi:hypothetical protein
MDSLGYVTAASIILGVAEFVFIASLASRDRFIYRMIGGAALPKSATADVLSAMKKQKLLRVRNAHMETVLEVHCESRLQLLLSRPRPPPLALPALPTPLRCPRICAALLLRDLGHGHRANLRPLDREALR